MTRLYARFTRLYQLGNWKAGKTLMSALSPLVQLYQLGNWKAGKTPRRSGASRSRLYQLGNWKAGKTVQRVNVGSVLLYQLGNWKAGKTCRPCRTPHSRLYQLGNWKAGKTESRQGSSGFPVAPAAESDNPPCAQKRLPVPSIVFRTFVSQGPVPVAGASSVS